MSESRFSIDWLSFTLPASVWGSGDPKEVLKLLDFPEDDFEERDRGLYAYKNSAQIAGGQGLMAWGGRHQQGTLHVSLPASALAWVRDVLRRSPVGLLEAVLRLGAKVTRIDLAFDDKPALESDSSALSFWQMFQCLQQGSVRARARGYNIVHDTVPIGEAFDPDRHGWTIYVGSRSSDSFIRIYNKAAEQDYTGHWVRVEVQIKGDKAPAFCEAWGEHQFSSRFASSILLGLLKFTVPNPEDSNKARWDVQPWWVDFVGSMQGETLSISGKMQTAEGLRRWVKRQVAPALAVLDSVWGEEILEELINDGASRWSPEHMAIIYAANIQGMEIEGVGVVGRQGEIVLGGE
jgi:phage replication initiation protein